MTSFTLDKRKLAYNKEIGYSFSIYASALQKWSVVGGGGQLTKGTEKQ